MTAVAIDVHFGRYARPAQGEIELHAVFGRHPPYRHRYGRETLGAGGLGRLLVFPLDIFSTNSAPASLAEQVVLRAAMRIRLAECDDRIAKDHEIGPATHLLNRVGGIGIAWVEVCAGRRGQNGRRLKSR